MTSNVGEALQAALARQWAEDDKAHKAMEHRQTHPTHSAPTPKPFQVTTNTNRMTFEQIKHHPDTRRAVIDAMVAQGHRESSVVALIGQMRRQGMVDIDDEGILHACIPEYRPVKNARTLRSLAKKGKMKEKREEKRPVSFSSAKGIAALPSAPAPVFVPSAVPPEQFVFHALEAMSVLQARAVYDELKKIFGEAK